MNIMINIIKLIGALALVALIVYGSLLAGKLENRQHKYSHPITRPGVTW